MSEKTKKIIAWVLIILPSVALLGSAFGKIAGAGEPVEMLKSWGLTEYILMIGIVELFSVILFLVPKTQVIGLLLLNAYLGGAIATHLQHDGFAKAVPAIVLLGLIWIGSFLRKPSLIEDITN